MKMLGARIVSSFYHVLISTFLYPFAKQQILDSSKPKESETTISSFKKVAESSPKG